MAQALGTVNTHGRGLLREWRWPVGPKLVSDHVAASVPEIMDDSSYELCASVRICTNTVKKKPIIAYSFRFCSENISPTYLSAFSVF
jgi:hypothetical protein